MEKAKKCQPRVSSTVMIFHDMACREYEVYLPKLIKGEIIKKYYTNDIDFDFFKKAPFIKAKITMEEALNDLMIL